MVCDGYPAVAPFRDRIGNRGAGHFHECTVTGRAAAGTCAEDKAVLYIKDAVFRARRVIVRREQIVQLGLACLERFIHIKGQRIKPRLRDGLALLRDAQPFHAEIALGKHIVDLDQIASVALGVALRRKQLVVCAAACHARIVQHIVKVLGNGERDADHELAADCLIKREFACLLKVRRCP